MFRSEYVFRAVDLSIVFLVLAPLCGIITVVSILSLLLHPRPVFFTQVREGKGGKAFRLIKFSSMDNTRTGPDNERLTSFGRLLRRSSLDEIPQIFNVVRGEMSLVGPRPLPPEILQASGLDWQVKVRQRMKPGLTGLSQIKSKGIPRSFEEKVKYDLVYVRKASLCFYFEILVKTLGVLIVRGRVNKAGITL